MHARILLCKLSIVKALICLVMTPPPEHEVSLSLIADLVVLCCRCWLEGQQLVSHTWAQPFKAALGLQPCSASCCVGWLILLVNKLLFLRPDSSCISHLCHSLQTRLWQVWPCSGYSTAAVTDPGRVSGGTLKEIQDRLQYLLSSQRRWVCPSINGGRQFRWIIRTE